jgi:hemoglobin
MAPESVSAIGLHDGDLYHMIGGMDTCRKLSIAFYAHVEHDPVLRPLYPPTLDGCPIKALAAFLAQFLGGPSSSH